MKVVLVVHSWEFDRVAYALDIASSSLAMGATTIALFTWGGLYRLIDGNMDEPGADDRVAEPVERMLETGAIEPLSVRYENAWDLGLTAYACTSAMTTLNVTVDDLREDLDGVSGLAKFLDEAVGADLAFYI